MSFPDRIFVFGDIHGCLHKLELLWDRIEPRPGLDQLVFLGDYIDRGEDSSGVLDYLLRLKKVYFETIFLMGNREFLKELHPYYETTDYIMVHAGLRYGIPLEHQTPDDLVWIREEFIYSEQDFGKRVIFGHTPFVRPLVLPNKIGIDTGAVYGNQLTCLILPDLEFVSV